MLPTSTPDLARTSGTQTVRASYINSLWHIFAWAVFLRVLVAVQVINLADIWQTGFEVARIARSIVQGQGFSSPFGDMTGATAWVPPVYPLFLAAVFKLFGMATSISACVVVLAQVIFSALTCVPIFRIAEAIFDRRIAVAAAWGWACFPYELLVPGISIWDSSLSALLLSVSIWLTLGLEKSSSGKQWGAFGLLWGVIALTNTTLVAVLPFQVAWLAIRQRRNGFKLLRPVAVAGLVFAAAVSPWLVRNVAVYGKFVPFRDNFGVELWIGNHEGGTGEWNSALHPSQSDYELSAFKQEGELAYVGRKRSEATTFITENPAAFAKLSIKRAYYFWFGEPGFLRSTLLRFLYSLPSVLAFAGLAWALKMRNTVFPVAAPVLTIPIAYYITHVNPRYRHPLEPMLMILCAYGVIAAARWGMRWRRRVASVTNTLPC